MFSSFIVTTLGLASLSLAQLFTVPAVVYNTSVDVELTSKALGELDFYKLSPGQNATSWDSWYFDAVSTSSQNESVLVLIEFVPAGDAALSPSKSPHHVTVAGTYANGSSFKLGMDLNEAVFDQTADKRMSLSFPADGFGFNGTSLLYPNPTYTVSFDSPAHGISGKITLKGVAPPHFACSKVGFGVSELLVPGNAWSNAQPDADATVDLRVNGTSLSFTGYGYHDKVWGNELMSPETLQSFYWGHARLGPYSIVWYNVRLQNGTLVNSAYIAEDGEILLASCANNAVITYAWGDSSSYPPLPGASAPSGMVMYFDLGAQGMFVANITNELTSLSSSALAFGRGSIAGGFTGGVQYSGHGLWEVLQFPVL